MSNRPDNPSTVLLHWRRSTSKGAHLCGATAKGVLKGLPLPKEILGFNRFQLNIGSYQKQWDPEAHPVDSFHIPKSAHYKLQSGRNPWVIDSIAPDFVAAGYKTSILLDTSRGRGKQGKNWDQASMDIPTGFAGGIKPENVADRIQEIATKHPKFFICAESGLRTNDQFDPAKVRACVEACITV